MSAAGARRHAHHRVSGAEIGPAVGSAACEAEAAFHALARMSLWLDSVDLDLTHEVVAVIEDVSDIASGLVILTNQIGHAEVERRAAR